MTDFVRNPFWDSWDSPPSPAEPEEWTAPSVARVSSVPQFSKQNPGNQEAWESYLSIYGRAITPGGQRRPPSRSTQDEIRALQHGRCLYCDLPIGSYVARRGSRVRLWPHWDHFVPYAYLQANPTRNWVLSCHICNGIKHAKMFDTVAEAQRHILNRWAEKGYQFRRQLTAPSIGLTGPIESVVDRTVRVYIPVPIGLAHSAEIVSRRLEGLKYPETKSRILARGGGRRIEAGIEALLAAGHVVRRATRGGYGLVSVEPYRAPLDSKTALRSGRPRPLLSSCPKCTAGAGQRCWNARGIAMARLHGERLQAADQSAAA